MTKSPNTESLSVRGKKEDHDQRPTLRRIAESTLKAIVDGFVHDGNFYDLQAKHDSSCKGTTYYAPDSSLSSWPILPTPPSVATPTRFFLLESSTNKVARFLATTVVDNEKVGILNFASAKKPGGGFLNGAQAQEESIARSSTLYPTLLTDDAQKFYKLHKRDARAGYYTHAMIYSPSVLIFRDDDGGWEEPFEVDVVTSPAVNAGVVRRSVMGQLAMEGTEERIQKMMKERMARILFLFEERGIKHVVLGSFGTGVFQNKVDMVARIWKELLVVPGARFEGRFSRVAFGILGQQTFKKFKDVFEAV